MRRVIGPVLLLACVIAVGWVHVLPLYLGGAEELARSYVQQDIRIQIYQAARGHLSPRELDAQVEQWIRTNRDAFEKALRARTEQIQSAHRFTGSDNREHVYLGDEDSYTWLRLARNYLQHGSTCDVIAGGTCRDTFVNGQIGTEMLYSRSLHVAAIVVLQRLIEWFRPGYPLSSTSFWVPVLLAMLSVVPAFFIGHRLAGTLGGVGAALLVSLNPVVLSRSIGSDNDAWNVFFPLAMVATAIAALDATDRRRQVLWSVAAAFLTALHATTWSGWIFTYVVLLAGLAATLVIRFLASHKSRDRRPRPHAKGRAAAVSSPAVLSPQQPSTIAGRLTSSAVVLLVLLGVTLAFVALLAPERLDVGAVVRLAHTGAGTASHPTSTVELGVWPEVFSTVEELQKANLLLLATATYGLPYLFLALLGIVLLFLPRQRWSQAHVVIFAVGAGICGWLTQQETLGALPVLALLSLPVLAALQMLITRGERTEQMRCGASAIVVIWWFSTFFASFRAIRFILLLAPSLGIAIGVAIGRAHEQLMVLVQRLPVRLRSAAAAAAWLLLVAVYLPAVQIGYAKARNYVPAIDDAWWDTLTNLREKTAKDAIVDVWWDFAYWTKFVAERRVIADGAMLQTHLPYWLGRVLISADENEAAGLLRMLSCGSEATPLPEGRDGAFGKLLSKLKDGVAAQAMVIELARRSRDSAAAFLGERGFSPAEQEDVLASTHCQAPETYLITGTDLTRKDSWMRLAAWDFRRAYIAFQAGVHGRDEVVADVTQRFGYSSQEAAALFEQARQLPRDEFVIGPAPRAPSVWYPCRPSDDPSALRCPLGLFDVESKKVIDEFVVNITDPRLSYFNYRQTETGRPPGPPLRIAPGALMVAEESLQDVALPEPRYVETGVLFDTHDWRILVGPPPLIRSTFTHLLFLNGRYARHFEKFDERQSYSGDRLVTWRLKF
ncbi:MAG: hypothetical protein HY270_05185 [Deltaproteobacteria bacterium]|nr:hypothetical protein [Deltaproteobacteria bacterium]